MAQRNLGCLLQAKALIDRVFGDDSQRSVLLNAPGSGRLLGPQSGGRHEIPVEMPTPRTDPFTAAMQSAFRDRQAIFIALTYILSSPQQAVQDVRFRMKRTVL